jgi:oxygen-dependent protoporphyrinogen oxidase
VGVRIAVVGGGISGLTAAFALQTAGHAVVCLEPSARPGGHMWTERRDGFLCEGGPEAVLDGAPDTRALIEALGLEPELVRVSRAARRRMIYVRGRLRLVPSDPLALLSTDLLSAGAKLRLMREPWIPARPEDDPEDETVLAFGERRLGAEAARNIVAPAILGIFAGDAGMLSVKSAFPRLKALETRHGSLIRGLRAMRKEGGPPGRAFSFRDGLERLPQQLAAKLGERLVRARAERLVRGEGGWVIEAVAAEGARRIEADAVVLATPPRVASALLAPVDRPAADALDKIPVAPAAVVCLGFASTEIGMDLGGYGFLVARGEDPQILGCQYESSVFSGRAPEGGTLLRVILGGAFEPGVASESEASLIARACADLRTVAGLSATPTFSTVFRIPEAIPQYHVGHAERVAAVEGVAARAPGLHVIGAALRGAGVNDCIRSATALARSLGAG